MTQTSLAFEEPKKLTRKEEVLKIPSDGKVHRTHEFCTVRTGTAGLMRLRELRAAGYPIEKQRIEGSAEWGYRIPWTDQRWAPRGGVKHETPLSGRSR